MSGNVEPIAKVVPAQLSFLAIYNPLLGQTDEEFRKQVVFYYSKESNTNLSDNAANDEENQKLRHVGLAQGMVDFARSFANGAAVDSVDTKKTRVVMREIEENWWILASVDLTALPVNATSSGTTKGSGPTKPSTEYSSREVSPPALLLEQLSQAHRMFRLHHGSTLTDLITRLGRDRFCNTLDRFWSRFAQRWDVLLHGSPAVSIYGGIKLAAGGELGIGVGEEEWGSGEREVLEEFARRTDGLVDVVVSRYGEPAEEQSEVPAKSKSKKKKDARSGPQTPWMGSGQIPRASDGVVFSGVGAISRTSLRDVSEWMESIYGYGEYAYGVRDNPSSDRKRRRRRAQREVSNTQETSSTQQEYPPSVSSAKALPRGIPRPIVRAAEKSLERASEAVEANDAKETIPDSKAESGALNSITDPEAWKYYLTLGYSSWGSKDPQTNNVKDKEDSPDNNPPAVPQSDAADTALRNQPRHPGNLIPASQIDRVEEMIKKSIEQENKGHFIIGLKGDMDEIADEDPDDSGSEGWNNRILLRTLYIELERSLNTDSTDDDQTDYEKMIKAESQHKKTHTRLRVVVYIVCLPIHKHSIQHTHKLKESRYPTFQLTLTPSSQHRPFIYTFLFTPRADSLTLASFYQNLHTYFSPLHAPLSASTSPQRITSRIASTSQPYTTSPVDPSSASAAAAAPIFDLVFDPRTLTLHSSIPDIPDPGSSSSLLSADALSTTTTTTTTTQSPETSTWTRIDALSVHAAILDAVLRTRRIDALTNIEQTGKTSRGWWVVWLRLPGSNASSRDPYPTPSSEAVSAAATAAATTTTTGRSKVQNGQGTTLLREAFLVRRARDVGSDGSAGGGGGSKAGGSGRVVSGLWKMGLGGSGEKMGGRAEGWGPKGMAEGIGIDARKYVETLLSLNR
ncbi:hypothetical protein EJ05DRAFT_309094 [Pseudovirgaria hyperparasitica]|uniref:CCZ1/INTU/HSP4 first Longin domain-containing protein n=1 Tax=Pseudovirgaria hyperparasitica TaxID=470096 RepID=A0A6A6WCJ7_9PEZI|nr:uncharacterized protein EJ05DRAFT_309094 [Pseudovirgaria hyperparasitica]KAF2759774.1 hypothetical protein EJ05DRAFT_309094 [Pseudovirgaria hyperparasitica]